MGDVIPFPRPKLDLHTASEKLDEAARQIVANAALFHTTREYLHSAERHGRKALAHLDRCHALLDWTEGFCNRCLAASDLADIDEMVRQRDALAEARKRHDAAEGSVKLARSASAPVSIPTRNRAINPTRN